MKKVYRAIGCMSGTSADGIDLALVETDGVAHIKPLVCESYPYSSSDHEIIKSAFGQQQAGDEVVDLITSRHIQALKKFGQEADIIGFHGQTIFHDPQNALSIQVGDPQKIADETGVPVVADLRQNDLKNGGQGAPLLPLYHFAKFQSGDRPALILNLGGVANLTYIGVIEEDLIALDTGPANALMDDYCQAHLDTPCDKGGAFAAKGKVNADILEAYLAHDFFDKPAPKSLDRDMWDIDLVKDLVPEDALATLAGFSIAAIKIAVMNLPREIKCVYVTGGGRHNNHIMQSLKRVLDIEVKPVEELGWDGDILEAEGFGYFAVRSIKGLPITYPGTTGVKDPLSGGKLYDPS